MKRCFFLLFFFVTVTSFPQEFGLGCLLDSALYQNSPTAAPLMRGDYDDLPPNASLKDYCPTPGNQGSSSTCSGWAAAYAGKTILEALQHKWNQNQIDSNKFSPSFVYNQIRYKDDCRYGTSLMDALDVLKHQGGVKLTEFGFDCSRKVNDDDKKRASEYRIIEYRDITSERGVNKTLYVRKSLAEHNPVIIALDVPPSFQKAKGVWNPDSSDYKDWGMGHAITVIGYDDTKFGGAFELLNSWGTRWGNEGYMWIKYTDFDYFCFLAFELIDQTGKKPQYDLSGELRFTENTGSSMFVKYNQNYFETTKSFPSGTLFELRITNDQPAYVYAFSSDLTYKTYKIFPFNDRMVAYLPYSRNNIAIPDEDNYNMLDTTSGKSYYCFLYSKNSLDIDALMKTVESKEGNFWTRVTSALGNEIVDTKNIQFDYKDNIKFRAQSMGKSVIPILVEINHTN